MRPVVIMGVQGTGKSTIGSALAASLGRAFVDADDLHPPVNKAKMAGGQPLDDDDRAPWLRDVAAVLARPDAPVVACSALTAAYRDVLRDGAPGTRFLHLVGEPDVLAARLAARDHEYMPATLLASQLGALEPLGVHEDGVEASVTESPDAIVARAAAWLRG